MKRWAIFSVMGIIVTAAVLGICGVGCDTVDSSNDVIIFEPLATSVTNGGDIVFSVTDTNATLFLPIEWSVTDSRFGLILPQGPLKAIYRAQPVAGVNTIKVNDQGNSEGTAIVYQYVE